MCWVDHLLQPHMGKEETLRSVKTTCFWHLRLNLSVKSLSPWMTSSPSHSEHCVSGPVPKQRTVRKVVKSLALLNPQASAIIMSSPDNWNFQLARLPVSTTRIQASVHSGRRINRAVHRRANVLNTQFLKINGFLATWHHTNSPAVLQGYRPCQLRAQTAMHFPGKVLYLLYCIFFPVLSWICVHDFRRMALLPRKSIGSIKTGGGFVWCQISWSLYWFSKIVLEN